MIMSNVIHKASSNLRLNKLIRRHLWARSDRNYRVPNSKYNSVKCSRMYSSAILSDQISNTSNGKLYAGIKLNNNSETIEHLTVMTDENEDELFVYSEKHVDHFMNYSPFNNIEISEFPDSNIKASLVNCSNPDQVLEVVHASKSTSISIDIARLAIDRIWSLSLDSAKISGIISPILDGNSDQDTVEKILNVFDRKFRHLNIDLVAVNLTQLCTLGVSLENPVLQKMFIHLIENREKISLDSICKLLFFIRSPDVNFNVRGKLLNVANKHISDTCSLKDVHLINLIIPDCRKVTTKSFINEYCHRILKMIENGVIDRSDTNTMLSIVVMISESTLFKEFEPIIGKVIECLSDEVHNISTPDLLKLGTLCDIYKTNPLVYDKVKKECFSRLHEENDAFTRIQLGILINPMEKFSFKDSLEIDMEKLVESPVNFRNLRAMYRLAKATTGMKSVNAYWDKVSNAAEYWMEFSRQDGEQVLTSVVMRYVLYNSILYRQEKDPPAQRRLIVLVKKVRFSMIE